MAPYDFTWDNDFWVTNIHVPFLDTDMDVVVVPEDRAEAPPSPRQIAAIDALAHLPISLPGKLDAAADTHRRRIHDMIDLTEEGLGDIRRDNIRDYYEIEEIVIPPHGSNNRTYHFLSAACEWEPEHGMEFLLSDGKVVSCTDQDCLYLSEAWNGYIR